MYLTIGTAQFGVKYGLNQRKIKSTEISKIKNIIKKNKIKYFDTSSISIVPLSVSWKNTALTSK